MNKRPLILIGPFSKDPTESVTAVSRALVQGLAEDYEFVTFVAGRDFGATRQGSFNSLNVYYFAKHLVLWVLHLLKDRPAIAHYAICSGWALEKAMIQLKVARLLNTKTVGHLHGGGFLDHWHTLSGSRKKWVHRELQRLDGLIVLSEGWRLAIVKELGFQSERLFVVNIPLTGHSKKLHSECRSHEAAIWF